MAKAPPAEDVAQALKELRCIAEIMTVLADNAVQNDETLPASWMVWLGSCVHHATEKMSDALDALNRPPSARGLHKPD